MSVAAGAPPMPQIEVRILDRDFRLSVAEEDKPRLLEAVRMVDDTSVLVPTAFQWHTVMTDDEGTVLDESMTPMYAVHGRSVTRLDTIDCTFSQVAYHELPDGGVLTIRVEGTVKAHLAP